MARPMKTRLAAALAGLALAALAHADTAPDDATPLLRTLETRLAGVKTVRTRFVQEKKLALFKNAVVTRGVILLEAPRKLAWRVEEPIRYALVMDGDRALQWDGETGRTHSFNTAQNPVFAAVAEQLHAWFGGQFARLAGDYAIRQTAESPVSLLLTPRENTMPARAIRHVTIAFRADGRYIQSVRIEDLGGDVTTLTFEDTVLDVPIPPADWTLP